MAAQAVSNWLVKRPADFMAPEGSRARLHSAGGLKCPQGVFGIALDLKSFNVSGENLDVCSCV